MLIFKIKTYKMFFLIKYTKKYLRYKIKHFIFAARDCATS